MGISAGTAICPYIWARGTPEHCSSSRPVGSALEANRAEKSIVLALCDCAEVVTAALPLCGALIVVTVWALPRPTLVRVRIAYIQSSIYIA
jgi:hypothetical protein